MSKYEKSNWIDNETVLKAEHMRKIEQGIVDLYDEIENVVIGNVDLSKYATTEYVDKEVKELSSQLADNTNKVDNRTIISVRDFGAKGDDKTDDTEAILNAITYCVENGKNELYIPNGKYIVSDTIEIPADFTLNLGADVKYDWRTTEGTIIKPKNNKTVFKLNSKSNIIGGLITTVKCPDYTSSCILIDYSDNRELRYISIKTSLRGINSKGVGIEIYSNNKGEGMLFPCYINANIEAFHTGIYTHKDEGNGTSWFSGLFIDGTIANCVTAINNEFGGNGGKISGSLQPLVGAKTSNEPFIILGASNLKFDAMIWDLDTAVNKKYIQNYGKDNIIISSYSIRSCIEDYSGYEGKLIVLEDFLDKYANLPISASNQKNSLKLMNGNQDNLLLGGNKRYDITEIKDNVVIGGGGGSLKPDGMWNANGAETYIVLNDKASIGTYTVEIPLDISRGVRAIGATFNVPPSNCKIELYSEKISNYKTVYDKDLKPINGIPIYAFWEYDYDRDGAEVGYFYEWKTSKIRFTFTIDPTVSNNCTVASLFAYDGSINVLGLHGGSVFGDIVHSQNSGTVLQSTNGNKYRLIVSDDGTLNTKKI